ncbi:hypothetical protein M406DRAFT_355386 [Cryphonectria parasitica EP155]|uniref:DUF7730 domain-containing protein n=1 Tax=Cryphonectria parasitica (strain ATCC 38755 / EP155) TaxID=660469 RepID=A0A9P4Y5H0_CRYP1|nr:uncharacterized protein M406DRAFT_355386 [Cryphonectria parasitica EP155]KAF3766856.1 hypothetical protein M406DRAFT_355386 [Cryphonectria parasitica EP155]
MERTSMFHQRCYETTYHLASEHVKFHTAIMAVCRLLYGEASEALYGRHSFDFGHHVQAVVPFLTDRTPYTLSLVSCICVYKRGPFPSMGYTSEKSEWSCMCRFLSGMKTLERLRVVMETGRPSDIKLLSLIGHESLEWVRELAQVKTLKELELVSEAKYLPVPKSSAMAVYAALSVSVEHGLVEYLKLEMAASCITSSVHRLDGDSS